MKKLFLILSLVAITALTSCAAPKVETTNSGVGTIEEFSSRFEKITIESSKIGDKVYLEQRLMYDKETKVVYMLTFIAGVNGYAYDSTPLMKKDGTCVTVDEYLGSVGR